MKRIISILLIISSILLIIPTTIFAAGNSSTVPTFNTVNIENNAALQSYVKEQVVAKKSSVKMKLYNFNGNDFKRVSNFISSFILNKTNTDVFSVNIKAEYLSGNATFDVSLEYRMNKDQEAKVMEWIKSTMDPFLATNPSDRDKIKFINDTIVKHVEYDASLQKKSAYNAVFDRTALCEGYAILGKMMLTYAKIENITIVGKAKSENHVWNMVKYGHNWYHLDFTWNDPIFISGNKSRNYVSYEYYMRSDKEIMKTHSWNKTLYPSASYSF